MSEHRYRSGGVVQSGHRVRVTDTRGCTQNPQIRVGSLGTVEEIGAAYLNVAMDDGGTFLLDVVEIEFVSGIPLTPANFAVLMQREIDANAEKGDWNNWQPSYVDLLSELHHHTAKLHMALYRQQRDEIAELAADVGNIAMKAAELALRPLPSIEEMAGIIGGTEGGAA